MTDRQGKTDDSGERIANAFMESQKRFEAAFRFAAGGMALVGLDGRWLHVNQAMCDIVGYSEDELMARTFQDITHPEDLDADLDLMKDTLRGNRAGYHMDKRYIHKDGHVVWIRLGGALVRDVENKPLYFVAQVQDVTDREMAIRESRRNLESLEQSELRYRTLLENVPIGIVECSADWQVQFANRVARDLFSDVDLAGSSDLLELLEQGGGESDCVARLRQSVDSGSEATCCGYLHTKGKRELSLTAISRTQAAPSDLAPGATVILMIQDITERRQADAVREKLPGQILAAQEVERKRLGYELHDGIQQLLAAARFRAQLVAECLRPDSPDKLVAGIAAISEALAQARSELRLIVDNLVPPELDRIGLPKAIGNLFEEFRQRTGITTSLHAVDLLRNFASNRQLDLYRIVQEALNNVERHSRATAVNLRCWRRYDRVHVQIEDNGADAKPAQGKRSNNHGVGLGSMRERVSNLRGEFILEDAVPGPGWCIHLILPEPRAQEKQCA